MRRGSGGRTVSLLQVGRLTCLLAALAVVLPLILLPSQGTAQDDAMRTAPEKTNYRETTRHADVLRFMEAAARAAPQLIRLDTFGYTLEGRVLPLAIVGRGLRDKNAETVRASGRTIVYVQGNIHAGEVEGKESLLMLLREIAQGRHQQWLDSLVLLVNPIYNGDGNERVLLTNRPSQHGPSGGMGQRPNAQDYDLNRDHLKLDSPEARSLVQMLTRFDPHVGVDLHTTNGSRHAYYLTYAVPMHPNTDSGMVALARQRWMPEVTGNIRQKYGWEYYWYGNVGGAAGDRNWTTFDYRARFNNNYLGLRNRFGILSEAYSYATFEDRILATSRFVEEVLDFAMRNASAIRRETARADANTVAGKVLAVRAEPERSAQQVEILMGEVAEERNPYSGRVMLRRLDVKRPERMWEYGTFHPTETVRAPRAYIIPANLGDVIDKLYAHGVRTTTLSAARAVRVERFRIDSTSVAAQPFQGHQERTLFGAFETVTENVPAGSFIVSLEQPLGRLAFTLLEPRSEDGFVNWNVMDVALGIALPSAGGRGGRGGGRGAGAAPARPATHYPILRTDEVIR